MLGHRKSYAPWVINGRALREAERFLGLSYTVKIHIDYLDDAWGEYLGINMPHLINLHSEMRHVDANKVLWHELIHAQQCERDFDGKPYKFNRYWLNYAIEQDILDADGEYQYKPGQYDTWLDDYLAMPCEQEAETLALKYSRTRKIITKS